MLLGVNVDHVATVREARKGREPDPLMAATLAMLGGADGITVHLREDRRHINDRDLKMLREMVTVELNLEMAATEEMIKIARTVKPDLVTLVPEKRQELTTEGGLDVIGQKANLARSIRKLQDAGIPVSLFINPSAIDVDMAKTIAADMVELHTGNYANATAAKRHHERTKVHDATRISVKNGLKVNAGHGLNYTNVSDIASMGEIRGLYIGHSIISRAVLVGMERAVREMKKLVK